MKLIQWVIGLVTGSIIAAAVGFFVVVGLCACLCLGTLAIMQGAGDAKTNKTIDELNNGKGSIEEPIAAGAWMVYDDGQVRATQLVRGATSRVEQMNAANPDPAAGAEYVLVWFDVLCQKDRCTRDELQFDLRDADGTEYDAVIFIDLDPYLKRDAVKGGTMTGWMAFEVPPNAPLTVVSAKWNTGVRLWQAVPSAG